eukprot:TRINITY_DN27678_c0_g1_i1.p2 TRINITY_DN27678_c0_g1~~TRINITY_DN27678_c0_g1_i1.p2  ORF type:complete len:362 (+),score=192.76 TRINITY_DN27678_c0_g1_i1:44-1087(+)
MEATISGTLSETFHAAVKLHGNIENSTADSKDEKKQNMVTECSKMFQELWRNVEQAKVFSPNEEIDDVATNDVKFFLILYYLGDIQERIVDTNRVRNLKNAIRCFQLFLKLCVDYSIISEKECEHLSTPINPTDRTGRIERLKKQKELQAMLADLSEKKKQLARRIAEEAGTADSGKDDEEREFEHDAVERKYWLLSVEDRLRASGQQMQMSQREATMLESLSTEQKEEAASHYQQQLEDNRGKPADPSALTRIEAAPNPFLMTSLPMDRERIMREVFMDRNPATMSDAEYAQRQMERMLAPDEPKNEDDDDSEDEEAHDRKQAKASKWDDWKDDHARDGNMGARIG